MARQTVKQQPRRRQPQRTCISCQRVGAKRGLIRVVRQPDGRVTVDPRGKAPGRGAYLCAVRACWQQALGQQRLDRALKVTLTPEQRAELTAYAQTLPEDRVEEPTTGGAGE